MQVQTLLGGIGDAKGFDIWIPSNDRGKLDWNLTARFGIRDSLPPSFIPIREIAEGIDVIWMERGGERPAAFYEVEHSTPVYSGLLRFNDVHLMLPMPTLRFGIVSNDERRALSIRQMSRPTFRQVGSMNSAHFSSIATYLIGIEECGQEENVMPNSPWWKCVREHDVGRMCLRGRGRGPRMAAWQWAHASNWNVKKDSGSP